MTSLTARFTTTGLLVLLTGLIFLAELISEFRLATWLPYLFLPIPASRLFSRHHFLLAVTGWSLLIAAGCLAPVPAEEATNALMNRAIGILGLWIVAYRLDRESVACSLRGVDPPTLRASELNQLQGPIAQALPPVHTIGLAAPAEHNPRILLVDDSIESHILMRSYLRNLPYDLEIAPDGEQAVAAFQNGRFDLVLIDLHLPGVDGFTATRAMRAWEASHKHPPIPIVAVTASSGVESQARSIEAGCTEFLTKPVTKARLLSTLRKYRRTFPGTGTAPAQPAASPDLTERIDDEIRRRRPAFLANRRKDVAMMQDALLQEDYDAIRSTGHRMKGLAGSFGFEDIGAVGHCLEQAARSRDREAIRREIDRLTTILAGVDEAA